MFHCLCQCGNVHLFKTVCFIGPSYSFPLRRSFFFVLNEVFGVSEVFNEALSFLVHRDFFSEPESLAARGGVLALVSRDQGSRGVLAPTSYIAQPVARSSVAFQSTSLLSTGYETLMIFHFSAIFC